MLMLGPFWVDSRRSSDDLFLLSYILLRLLTSTTIILYSFEKSIAESQSAHYQDGRSHDRFQCYECISLSISICIALALSKVKYWYCNCINKNSCKSNINMNIDMTISSIMMMIFLYLCHDHQYFFRLIK